MGPMNNTGADNENQSRRRDTRSLRGTLQLPEALWVGLLLLAAGGFGSAIALWNSSTAQFATLTSEIRSNRRDLDALTATQDKELERVRTEVMSELRVLRGEVAQLNRQLAELLARQRKD